MAMVRMMTVMRMTCGMSWDHCASKNHQRDGSEKHTTKVHCTTPYGNAHCTLNAIHDGSNPARSMCLITALCKNQSRDLAEETFPSARHQLLALESYIKPS